MLKRIRMMWIAFQEIRKAKKNGLTHEEARMRAFKAVTEDLIPDDEMVEFAEIPEVVETYFEDDAQSHLWNEEAVDAFVFTKTHISLLRQLKLSWNGAETGAPHLDPVAPLTSHPMRVLGSEFNVNDPLEQARLYVELVWALNHYFSEAAIEPGEYQIDEEIYSEIQNAMTGYSGINNVSDIGLTADGKIRLERENITTLKNIIWDWDESGADEGGWPGAAIDCKRPYGEMSNWYPEMADLLGLEMEKDGEGFFQTTSEQENRLQSIHLKQLSAVTAILKYGKIDL